MKKIIFLVSFLLFLTSFCFATPGGQDQNESFVNQKVMITVEGGIAIKLTNKSGTTTVKGYIVEGSSDTDNAVQLVEVDSVDPIGVFYEDGIADGEETFIVIAGIAEVYYSTTTTVHQFARVMVAGDDNDANGHAIAEAFPSSPFATDKHFQEIGHVIEGRSGAGLAKTVIHFN